MPITKQDSNFTSLSIAEEETPGVLPGSPVWYAQEPNSYNDFGGEITTVARETINPLRQRQRGVTTDFDASGGFQTDYTQNNLTRLMQGFLFADALEKFSTQPLNGSAITITAVDGTNHQYEAASGLDDFLAGDIVLASGFTNAGNNGMKVLDAVASGAVDSVSNLVAEASPPAAAKLEAVGFQFASGDATMTVASGVATLGATTKDLTELNLNVGEWVFIGGDAAGVKFATCPVGYARVKTISEDAIVFDKVTAAFVTDNGASKTIQIFFGKFLRNAKETSEIVSRTYQLERQLGNDDDGVQSEILTGSYANELTMNFPKTSKLTAELGFIAMNNEFRDGATGIKAGTRVAALKEQAYNSSSDLYRAKLSLLDPLTLQPTALFAYLNEVNISLNNNVTPNKALGVAGAFSASVGTFEVGGSASAYFTTTEAAAAVKDNSDVTIDVIIAKSNYGAVFDIPLMGVGGGRVNVEKDSPIELPLENFAAENPAGYTFSYTSFQYLPNAAMP